RVRWMSSGLNMLGLDPSDGSEGGPRARLGRGPDVVMNGARASTRAISAKMASPTVSPNPWFRVGAAHTHEPEMQTWRE
ncbi:MAG: hypothetical protein OEY03_10215, partial [Rhizobacter sp.]|nr:hypothetical protein [Rhizobacter sp.]